MFIHLFVFCSFSFFSLNLLHFLCQLKKQAVAAVKRLSVCSVHFRTPTHPSIPNLSTESLHRPLILLGDWVSWVGGGGGERDYLCGKEGRGTSVFFIFN